MGRLSAKSGSGISAVPLLVWLAILALQGYISVVVALSNDYCSSFASAPSVVCPPCRSVFDKCEVGNCILPHS